MLSTRLSFRAMSAGWRIVPFLLTATAAVAQSTWFPMPWPGTRGYAVTSYDPNTASVLMAAGYNDFDLGDTWRWHGNTATWEPVLNAGALTPRHAPGLVYSLVQNTHVLFGGGHDIAGYFNQTFLWNVASSTWQLIVPGTSPAGRAYSPLAYDANRGRVVLFGGYAYGSLYGDTWEWNGNTWLSPTVVNPPSPRYGHSFAFAQSNSCVLFGGNTSTGTSPSSQTWLWNGTTWTLQAPPQSPSARWYHATAHDPIRGQLVLYGGWDGNNSLADTWLWNGATWTQASANGPGPRHLHSMTFDVSRGRVVLFGGNRSLTGSPLDILSDVWEWDGTAWSQVHATMPRSRDSSQGTFHAGTTAATRHTLVYGGRIGPYPPSNVMDDTWLWDGVTWTKQTLASSPPARSYSAITFDPLRSESVLFGGWPANTPDTWVWDGTQWLQRTPATSPSGRHGHSTTYHPGLGKVVLFGGWDGAALNDLWTWDGINWANITPGSGNPPERWHHAIAYDPPNNRIVLFGGVAASGSYTDDTWAWSSSTGLWTQLSPTLSPAVRGYHKMAYDPSRGYVVLVDGYNNSVGSIADTWELQGSQWVLCAQTNLPPARHGHVLAYDPDRARLYMFGGYGPASDFWEAYNPWQATFTEISGSAGCPVGGTVLGLTNNDPNYLPWLGGMLSVTHSNPPTGFPLSIILFGVAPSIAVPLPWPGCTLYCNWTVMLLSVVWPHTEQVPIPPNHSLLGLELCCQGGVLNGPAIGLTKGFEGRIGTRK